MFKNFIRVFLLTVSLCSFSSCLKQGCTYFDAANYDTEATSDDGSCHFQAADYVGTYNVTGIKVDQDFNDTTFQEYQMIITQENLANIKISNLGASGFIFIGSLKNNQLLIPGQKVDLLNTWQGTGTCVGNKINMQFSSSFDDDFYSQEAILIQ